MDEKPTFEDKVLALMERQAAALEHLADDPVISVESGPPICPHCERMNPSITVREGEASGPLFTFVIQAICNHCQNLFYVLPQMWLCLKEVEQVKEEIAERENANGGN